MSETEELRLRLRRLLDDYNELRGRLERAERECDGLKRWVDELRFGPREKSQVVAEDVARLEERS